jgi:chromosome segregation ATPase
LLKVKNAIEDVDANAQKQAATALNTVMNDGFKVQIAAFQEFAKTIAENNSKALIEALSEVMRDFNAKINEQFGDNFKQLNEAVGRLLTWQEAYRQQLDQLREQMTASQVAISESKTALEAISTHASALPPAAEALSKLLTTAQAQIDDLSARLSAFAALKDKAESAMPTLSKMLDDFTKSMTEKTGTLLSAIETENKSLRTQSETLRAEWTRTLESQKVVADSMVAEQQRLNRDTQERFANMTEDLTKRLGGAVEISGKNLDALVKALDDQMQEEMKRAIGLMGKHLASIMEKLVQDHAELADYLRRNADFIRNPRP